MFETRRLSAERGAGGGDCFRRAEKIDGLSEHRARIEIEGRQTGCLRGGEPQVAVHDGDDAGS